ncbi:MAG: hypothetical protein COS84_06320 [Armatimonadetes bacterium CG07_land_8_20_14_0_80_40_9]|nr:MAG: hypothetical protein COS84_06320 [Armatimonadetes bacterium CG07_land_8_20_14_0_80_40_9]
MEVSKVSRKVTFILLSLILITFSSVLADTFTVQVGAFKSKVNAERLIEEINNKGYAAYLKENKDGFTRVWVGSFSTKGEADRLARVLMAQGYPVLVKKVLRPEELPFKPKPEVGRRPVKPKPKVEPVKPEVKVKVKKPKPEVTIKEVKKLPLEPSKIEVGVFRTLGEARELRDKLIKKGYFAYIVVEEVPKKSYSKNYKVVVEIPEGKNRKEMEERLKEDGFELK